MVTAAKPIGVEALQRGAFGLHCLRTPLDNNITEALNVLFIVEAVEQCRSISSQGDSISCRGTIKNNFRELHNILYLSTKANSNTINSREALMSYTFDVMCVKSQ